MLVPITTFSRWAADLRMGVLPQKPAVGERFLENVALLCDAGREVIVEPPAVTQQPGVIDAETFAAPATCRLKGLVMMQPRRVAAFLMAAVAVHPVAIAPDEEPTSIPTVPLGKEGQGFQIGCA